MSKELLEYINDTEDPLSNLFLGYLYEKQDHHSPASSFYLRCAEFAGDNLDLKYEGILRTYLCYKAVGGRPYTVECLLKLAISFAPNRPEAYFFLSRFYADEKQNELDAYLYACIGLSTIDGPSKFFIKMDEFTGMHVLLFQKAYLSWSVGKPDQARQLYQYLIDNHISEMSPQQRDILQNHVMTLGHKSPDEYTREYKKEFHHRLKFKFDGSENIEKNYSQAYQDMMTLFLHNGKRNGTYLEIGSSKPFESSNTFLLENQFDWNGVGVEIDESKVVEYRNNRKNSVIHADAASLDYYKVLEDNFPGIKNIDYLQLDVEPAKNTFKVLFEIPFDDYKFAVITYEHDYAVDVTRSYRNKSRRFFMSLGYEMLVNDIGNTPDSSFEDWWYHPDLISAEKANLMRSINLEKNHYINKFMLND